MHLHDLFEAAIMPLVAIHAAHTLKRDWSHMPRIPGKSTVSIWSRFVSVNILATWLAMQIAPVAYYSIECVKQFAPMVT